MATAGGKGARTSAALTQVARASGRKRTAVDYREDKQPLFRTDSDDEPDAGGKKPKSSTGTWQGPVPEVHAEREAVPTRDADGVLHFEDFPEFRPNLTPAEVRPRLGQWAMANLVEHLTQQ